MLNRDKIFIREDRPGVGCFKTTVFDLQRGLVFINHEDIVDIMDARHQYSPAMQKLIDKQNRRLNK